MTDKIDLRSLNEDELTDFVTSNGEKPFRAKQLFVWMHKNHAQSLFDCKNLPNLFLLKIAETAQIAPVIPVQKISSDIDKTIKYLFELEKEAIIESVRIKQSYGNTVCVSTQEGCNMACKFCASAIGGKKRDLTAGEMVGQIYEIERDVGERISNVVLMGSGEPLENYDNTLRLIRLLNAEKGANISQRNITLSTCGLIDEINRLSNETINGKKLQITLAVSLHAPNDEIRKTIMPVARKYPFNALLSTCHLYTKITGRRITFEYALIKNVNDAPEHAHMLAQKLKGMLCHVNLIPMNQVEDNKNRILEKSENATIKRFTEILNEKGIEASVRKEHGADINAACGQLRRKYKRA